MFNMVNLEWNDFYVLCKGIGGLSLRWLGRGELLWSWFLLGGCGAGEEMAMEQEGMVEERADLAV
jgi:hypothetical protein